MLIDIMNMENYISYNISIAKVFGLNAAVYCSELLSILSKAQRKNKMVEGEFFKLDRKYITNRTTLSVEEQLRVDNVWMKYGILTKYHENPDTIKVDVELLFSIVSSEDCASLDKLKKDISTITKRDDKSTKKSMVTKALKDSIECSNYELLTALRNWVDCIFDKFGYMSKVTISSFQKTLNEYTKGDLDLALRIVEIATIQGYKMCDWAIKVYEDDKRTKKINENFAQSKLRVSKQRVATKDSINKTLTF